jgi:hypothetical protein
MHTSRFNSWNPKHSQLWHQLQSQLGEQQWNLPCARIDTELQALAVDIVSETADSGREALLVDSEIAICGPGVSGPTIVWKGGAVCNELAVPFT